MPKSAYRVSLRHRAGPLDLDLQFTIDAPWTVLFAPSGAGKTTILRLIAGLERPTAGHAICIYPGGTRQLVLFDTESRIFTPQHNRATRMVAQRPALFPHLSVIRNVLYRMSPQRPREREEAPLVWDQKLDEIIHLCRIDHLRDKMPAQLSGGERQRVALARTLASFPADLLLLDEPFTGLEASLRDDIISDLRDWTTQQATPVLLVTHDLGEVFAAQAHVLKMADGRIAAYGPAHEVLAEERARLLQRLAPYPYPFLSTQSV